MKRMCVTLMSMLALASPLTAAAPASASHATVSASPSLVVLYLAGPTEVTVTVDGITDLFTVEAFCVTCPDPNGDEGAEVDGSLPERIDSDSWRSVLRFGSASQPGLWETRYTGSIDDGGTGADEWGVLNLEVKRNTILTFDAAPENLLAGSYLGVAGRLTRMTPNGYVGYYDKRLVVEFRPRGGSSFTKQGATLTDINGYFASSPFAQQDGTWRVRFAGTEYYHRETSRHDFIDLLPR